MNRRRPTLTRGTLRVVRGSVLACCSAVLAVAAHAFGGGGAPDTGPVILVTLLIAGAGVALADRRRGALAVVAALGVSHTFEHLALSVLAHAHDGPAGGRVDGPAMAGAHVLAVLLTALLLAGAESALFVAAAAIGMVLPRKPLSTPPLPTRRPAAGRYTDEPAGTEQSVLHGRIIRRRGPPVLA